LETVPLLIIIECLPRHALEERLKTQPTLGREIFPGREFASANAQAKLTARL